MIEFDTAEEYYNFFEAIPEKKWCTGRFQIEPVGLEPVGQRCAIGHLTDGKGDGYGNHPFRDFLSFLDKGNSQNAASINNGSNKLAKMLGDTPKERILNALLLKANGLLK